MTAHGLVGYPAARRKWRSRGAISLHPACSDALGTRRPGRRRWERARLRRAEERPLLPIGGPTLTRIHSCRCAKTRSACIHMDALRAHPDPPSIGFSSPCELLVDIDEFHISVMTSRSWSADSDVDPIFARTLRQSHYHNAFARSVTQRCQPWLRRGAVPGACGPHDRCSH